MAHRPWTGYLLAAIGVSVLLAEIGLHFYGYFTGVDYKLNPPVLYVAMVIGFVGFYMINPKGAEGGTDILTRSVVAIISVVRTVNVQVTPVDRGVPNPAAATTVTVPNPADVADPAAAAILADEAVARRAKHAASPPVAEGEG
jgi:hypothetical protein